MDPKGSMTNGTRICGICQRSTSWLSYASSPAFAIDDYDFKNETYSTWTESQWTIFSGRIFLKQSPGLDQGFLATGIIVFLFSLFFVSAALFAHSILKETFIILVYSIGLLTEVAMPQTFFPRLKRTYPFSPKKGPHELRTFQ